MVFSSHDTELTTTNYWRQTNLIQRETTSPLHLWPYAESRSGKRKNLISSWKERDRKTFK